MLLNLRETRGPLYRRVYLALKTKIRAGGLGPAARVPSTRALARDLGVSRNTVMLAYEQLAAEGYLVSRHRGATSVARVGPPRPALAPARPAAERPAAISAYARRLTARLDLAPSHPPGPRPTLRYDFRYGRPAVDEFPREIWRRLLAAHARRASADALGYGSPAGHAPLRVALSEYLGRARGVVSDPDRIVVVNGTQQALDLLARVLLDPGDGAVVEEPHYPGATIPFEAVGARLLRVPVDADGLDPARLPGGAQRPRLAYVTPCHQFPTGVIMPLERRLALLRWASRVGAWVVEDDYVSEFRYEGHPLEALQSLDRDERAIYLGRSRRPCSRRSAWATSCCRPRWWARSWPPSGPRIASRPRSTRGPSPTSSPAGSSSGTSAAREPGTRAAGAPSSPPSASGSAIAWRSRERTPACTWWCG